MSSNEKNGLGIGSIFLIVCGGVTAAGLAANAVTHCSDQKTERRRIDFRETELLIKAQERFESIKEKFHKKG